MVEAVPIDCEKETSPFFSPPVSNSSSDGTSHTLLRRMKAPVRRSTKGGWTEEEDQVLSTLVKQLDGRNWKIIAEAFPGRTDVQCLHRWQKVLNPELVKGNWTKEEDDCIVELVGIYGRKKWSVISKSLPGRIGKQCRERWHNHLDPSIKRDAWTLEEEKTLIECHKTYGNKWAEIAKVLPGRTDNSIKNHWNCSLKKRLASGDFGQDFKNCTLKVEFSEADAAKQSILEHRDQTSHSTTRLELNGSGNSPDHWFNRSPCASSPNLSCKNCFSGDLVGHVSDFSCNDGSAPDNSSADSKNGHAIQSQMCNALCSLSPLETPHSGMPTYLAVEFSEDDRVGTKVLAPRTTQSTSYLPFWKKNVAFYSFSENANHDGDIQQNHSQMQFSTPSNSSRIASIPISPSSILRSAAKSFKKKPSILRKQKRQSSKQLFTDCQRATSSIAKNSSAVSDNVTRDDSFTDILQSAV